MTIFDRKNLPFVIVVITAVCLRFYTIGAKGLWIDEAYSVLIAQLGFIELLQKLALESTPPLYYILLQVWINIFGLGEGSVRILSAIFSIGGIFALYFVTKRYFSQSTALVAVIMITFSPLHIYYAQEARMYSLSLFGAH